MAVGQDTVSGLIRADGFVEIRETDKGLQKQTEKARYLY